MADTSGYPHLPESTRIDVLAATRKQAEQAVQRYADLQAAEAGIAARNVFPDLARLTFRLTDDIDGPSATLIAGYTAQGRRLWHVDADEEWPDESLVSDHLAAAADWCPDYFPPADEEDVFLLDLGASTDVDRGPRTQHDTVAAAVPQIPLTHLDMVTGAASDRGEQHLSATNDAAEQVATE